MITPRNKNPGSSVQKCTPKSSASPGASLGIPTQGASNILSASYMPNPAAAMQPPTIAIRGAHRRSNSEPRRARAATMIKVTSAVKGAAVGSTFDDLSSRSKTTEARVIDRIIITVPPTVGVTILLRMNSHLETTSWTTADTSTKVVSVAGPPSTTA